MRSFPSEVLALIESGRFSVRHMVRAELDEGPEGLWDGDYALSYGGVTYHSLAGNMHVPDVPSSSELSSEAVVLTLGLFDPAIVTVLGEVNWHQRPATLFRAWLNDAGNVIYAEPWYSGFMDAAPSEDAAGGLATVSLTIENNNRELSRASGRRSSDNDQRKHGNATDGFFKYGPAVAAEPNIYWGRKGPRFPARNT